MSIIDQIFQAGIVGCGGAGFPTHVKFAGKIEHLIVNGAECEPLLRTDRYLMRHFPGELVSTLSFLKEELGVASCTIGLKASYAGEIEALRKAIKSQRAAVSIHAVDSFYPAGDEQVLVYEVTGKVVPPAGIPIDVGCVVSNVATILAIADARRNIPFTHKFLTVTGEVHAPAILRVPLGMPLADCVALSGGTRLQDYRVLLGGPMMGHILTKEQAKGEVVQKTTSGIVLLRADHYLVQLQEIDLQHVVTRARAACIRCSQCTDLCPRYLLGHPLEPHKIMRMLALESDLRAIPPDSPVLQSALLCSECGICEMAACPMGLQPRRVNSLIKKQLTDEKFRYPKGKGQPQVHIMRAERRPATRRVAARAGVIAYQDYHIDRFVQGATGFVRLPLLQHIGAPCRPVVESGSIVSAGQLIAECPEGKLGMNLHASITGVAQCSETDITITTGTREGSDEDC